MAVSVYVIKAPPIWVYFFVMTLDEFEKMPIVLYHYKKATGLKT